MKILVINAGSSSLKYQLLDSNDGALLAKGLCERIGMEKSCIKHSQGENDAKVFEVDFPNHKDAVAKVIELLTSKEYGVIASLDEIDAVGHRVVHGGEAFAKPALINDEVKKAIEACYDLAPLHNPANMTGILACEEVLVGKPQVAVFDTSFHQTMPEKAFMYGLPYEYYKKYNVRRYGFHGTSHSYVASRAAKILERDIKELKIVTCHLGNGSSIAAVDCGKCVDTSMGMTPLAGLSMGTRCGDIDPAIIKYLMDLKVIKDIDDADVVMNKKSGMLGLSEVSSDFRDLSAAAKDGNKQAALALDLFCYQIKKYIASYAAAMGGIDLIVFTAGVGENTPSVRAKACEGLEFMGVIMDDSINSAARSNELVISSKESKVTIMIVPTNEELSIAKEVSRLLL